MEQSVLLSGDQRLLPLEFLPPGARVGNGAFRSGGPCGPEPFANAVVLDTNPIEECQRLTVYLDFRNAGVQMPRRAESGAAVIDVVARIVCGLLVLPFAGDLVTAMPALDQVSGIGQGAGDPRSMTESVCSLAPTSVSAVTIGSDTQVRFVGEESAEETAGGEHDGPFWRDVPDHDNLRSAGNRMVDLSRIGPYDQELMRLRDSPQTSSENRAAACPTDCAER